jgi:hypothetical protein
MCRSSSSSDSSSKYMFEVRAVLQQTSTVLVTAQLLASTLKYITAAHRVCVHNNNNALATVRQNLVLV